MRFILILDITIKMPFCTVWISQNFNRFFGFDPAIHFWKGVIVYGTSNFLRKRIWRIDLQILQYLSGGFLGSLVRSLPGPGTDSSVRGKKGIGNWVLSGNCGWRYGIGTGLPRQQHSHPHCLPERKGNSTNPGCVVRSPNSGPACVKQGFFLTQPFTACYNIKKEEDVYAPVWLPQLWKFL